MHELDYILDAESEHIYIVRFRTSDGHVACRLSYVRDDSGSYELGSARFRKTSFLEEDCGICWRRISNYPGDQVYLIPIDKTSLLTRRADAISAFKAQAAGLLPALLGLEQALASQNCSIGLIGSRLVFAQQSACDFDVSVSGEGAWEITRAWVERAIADHTFTRRHWKEKEHDRLWQDRLGLSDAIMDAIRSWQWWKHLVVSDKEFSFSYTARSELAELDIAISEIPVSMHLLPPVDGRAATAPYLIGSNCEENHSVRAGLSACWFLRGNQQEVTVSGHLCRLSGADYVWCAGPHELHYSPALT